jgi:hypothetical protein
LFAVGGAQAVPLRTCESVPPGGLPPGCALWNEPTVQLQAKAEPTMVVLIDNVASVLPSGAGRAAAPASRMRPGRIEAGRGLTTFRVVNDGAGRHRFIIHGRSTGWIEPGTSRIISVAMRSGTFVFTEGTARYTQVHVG